MDPVVSLGVPDPGECLGPPAVGWRIKAVPCYPPGGAVLDLNVLMHVVVLFRIYPPWNDRDVAADPLGSDTWELLCG